MLEIRGLKKMYGITTALDELDMQIPTGSLYGFVGPNGAGKTTTLRILVGLLAPDGGSILLDGEDLLKNAKTLSSRIGYVPDDFGVYDNLKVWEYMDLFAGCGGLYGLAARQKIDFLLDQVGLGGREDYYVDGLSRGMKQRLSLARALIHNPDFLIMDEPGSGLDPRTRLEFRSIIKELQEQGKTILLSSHLLEDLAEICTDIGIIDQGKLLLEGSMEEIQEAIHTRTPIRITVFGGREQALAILRSHPFAEHIAIRGNEIAVGFSGDRQEEALLLQQLCDAGVLVNAFFREKNTLEAIFMQLTDTEKEVTLLHEG